MGNQFITTPNGKTESPDLYPVSHKEKLRTVLTFPICEGQLWRSQPANIILEEPGAGNDAQVRGGTFPTRTPDITTEH